jgi:hypothetical protein
VKPGRLEAALEPARRLLALSVNGTEGLPLRRLLFSDNAKPASGLLGAGFKAQPGAPQSVLGPTSVGENQGRQTAH